MKPQLQNYVVALATKAEGKALRRALKINVIVAEEKDEGAGTESNKPDKITNSQVSYIDTICRRNNIDVEKATKKSFDVKKLNDLSNEQAANLLRDLSKMQRDQNLIGDLQGYAENWKEAF